MVFFLIRCYYNHLIGPLLLCVYYVYNLYLLLLYAVTALSCGYQRFRRHVVLYRTIGRPDTAGRARLSFYRGLVPLMLSEWVYEHVNPVFIIFECVGSPWILFM